MSVQGLRGRWCVRALTVALASFSVALLMAFSLSSRSVADSHGPFDLPIDPSWVVATTQSALNAGQFTNHILPGAIQARDENQDRCPTQRTYNYSTHSYVTSQVYYCRQEYLVTWAGKANAADVEARTISDFIQNMTVNPEGLQELAVPQFAPGMDALVVVDARKYNADHTFNPYYGRVVNIATLSIDGGVECEPHHMQYSWINGENLILGCLFSSWSFGVSVKDIPAVQMLTTNSPMAVPIGSVPDAFDAVQYDNQNHANDRYIGTWMGGPLYNYAGSPGALVSFSGDGKITGETPAGSFGEVFTNPIEAAVCQGREAEPAGTCANPHGIQARPDLGLMEVDDYAEPREIVTDPVKPFDVYSFRPTVHIFSIANINHPTLYGAAHMPETWRQPLNRAHVNIGIMEGAKTHAAPDGTTCGAGIPSADCRPGDGTRFWDGAFLWSKGMFSGSMCGGGIFWTPDITKDRGDASSQYHQVWDDGFSQLATGPSGGAESINGNYEDEPGGCAGGAWHQVSANNRWLFRSVQGRVPIADNYFDQGSQKMVYLLDISHLVADGERGIERCNMNQIDPKTGVLEGLELARITAEITPQADGQLMQNPATEVGDCPTLLDVLIVHDPTTGGPHWGSLDDHSLDQYGYPTRMAFDDYFVARTGVDGDHREYVVDISPAGHLTYDQAFRDEDTGSLGVDFNRRDWIPNNGVNGDNGYAWPDGGEYKPHAMVWVCPPGDCADDNPYGAG
jgi:hypothetical protein